MKNKLVNKYLKFFVFQRFLEQMRKVPKYKQLSIQERIELIALIGKGEKKLP